MRIPPRRRMFGPLRSQRWLVAALILALTAPGTPIPLPTAVVHAQGAPVGANFVLDAGDLRFIFRQIQIAQEHAAGGALVGTGSNQIPDVRLPFGLRTVDGRFNHLRGETRWKIAPLNPAPPDNTTFGSADRVFPRVAGPADLRPAEDFDPDGPNNGADPTPTSYAQTTGVVVDSHPRVVSNLIVDQTDDNPAALAVEGARPVGDEVYGHQPLFIANTAPDVGLSAPFNQMFTFFGQFFDHGLDLVNKNANSVVFVPLKDDDPLIAGPDGDINTIEDNLPPSKRFLPLNRATLIDGTHEAVNQTTPFVDQNQTYTSHPSHQVFLRQYELVNNEPIPTGRVLDGAIPGNIANWREVKQQAREKLGILLEDTDVFDVPLLITDPYGHFIPGPLRKMPQILTAGGAVETDINAPISTAGAIKTGHAFLDDIAHNAKPGGGKTPDADTDISDPTNPNEVPTPTEYDDELLAIHFVTGDGRGNENIALTAVHTIFHSEHNRLRDQIFQLTQQPGLLTQLEINAWHAPHAASGWDYGERLFQAARFVTEMQYQHLVFEEFARTLVPSINVFIGDGINFQSDTNPAIFAEFAHAVYRLGHSMLTENVRRIDADLTTTNDLPLVKAFLNPQQFNGCNDAGANCRYTTAGAAAGALFQGNADEVGNQIDEFITEALRNQLLGLPLDLAVFNIARGRSEGVTRLNQTRRRLFQQTQDSALKPYANWFEFSLAMTNPDSLVNFVAAYGRDPVSMQAVRDTAPDSTLGDNNSRDAARRAAGDLIANQSFMFAAGTTTGLEDIDLWIGGLAERVAPFGSMLGTTFQAVFERQLENLQNADRFYYLERLDGLNLLVQLEGNSFSELVMRNSTAVGLPAIIFSRADFVFNVSRLDPDDDFIINDDPTTPEIHENEIQELVRTPDGAFRYFGDKHVVWNGRDTSDDPVNPGGEMIVSSEGDDTIRGNGGNDFAEGGSGNDNIIGGAGDDILLDVFGEDTIKGGPGNDAISGGLGPFDLLQGNEGDDFIVGGNDLTETFGGPGDDVMYTGEAGTEAFGGGGDDWIEGGPQLDLLVGDQNNQFQNDPDQGHDVIIGGKGDDDYDSEGGDDIMVADVLGTERLEGMLGWDWVTYRGETLPVDADMDIGLAQAPAPDELRDRFDLTEAVSGGPLDDIIRGDGRGVAEIGGDTNNDLIEHDHALTGAGIRRVENLQALLGGFGIATPVADTAVAFEAGNLLMGGAGNDQIEGRGADDLIDGDAWLNVQLRAPDPNAPGGFSFYDTLRDPGLMNRVFTGQLNPGSIDIVRRIENFAGLPADCAPATRANCDTAIFSDVFASYDITNLQNGLVRVVHARGTATDGTDLLRNIERLQFSDLNVSAPGTGQNEAASGAATITGAVAENSLLTASTAGIVDSDGINQATVAFTWQVEAAPVGSNNFTTLVTSPTFTPGDPQVGLRLRVSTTFTDGSGNSETVVTAPTALVANVNDAPTGVPTLSQLLPQENEPMTVVTTAIADGDGLPGSLNIQWQRSAAGGGAPFTNVGTANNYTPVQGDVGRSLRVRVTYTDLHGSAETVFSTLSGVVGDVFAGTANVDNYTGTAGRDDLSGAGSNDTLDGNGGDDRLAGGAGNDTLIGNTGNDTLIGGAGDDTINAGADNDTIRVGLNDGSDSVTGGGGTDTILATANGTVIGLSTLAGVENITTSNPTFTASIVMSGLGNTNDTFNLSAAAVTLTNIVAVTINGNGGADTITGSPLADIITGGAGADTMNGGAGADTFKVAAGFSGATAGTGDTINGFDANPTGGQDKIDLTALGITAATFGQRVLLTTSGGGSNTVVTVRTPTATPGVFVTEGVITIVGVAPGAGANQINSTDFVLVP